jgi:hypothetical protein
MRLFSDNYKRLVPYIYKHIMLYKYKQIVQYVYKLIVSYIYKHIMRPTGKEASDSKKCSRFSRTRTILTSARICPNSTGQSAGWGNSCTPSFSKCVRTEEGEYCHLVTLWKATKQEQELYGEHS